MIALTQHVAIRNARHGIRANVILPGLMNTPMAIENRVGRDGKTRDDLIAERDAKVPLGQKMGTAWDVAEATLLLCSDEARFITGAAPASRRWPELGNRVLTIRDLQAREVGT